MYGVPWSSSISSHPMRDWIAPSACRPSVSLIYNKIIDCITKHLSIITIWNRELSDLNLSVDWERVWSNLSLTSKNLAHRLIHFKVIHRAVQIHLLMLLDTSSVMFLESLGVSGLSTSYTLIQATQLRLIRPQLVSSWRI